MSADNGIYILHTFDGFRVAHLQAIDNLYYVNGDVSADPQPNAMIDFFGKSKLHPTREEAMAEARGIFDEVMRSPSPIVEYGICVLEHGDLQFPKERVPVPREQVWSEAVIKIAKLIDYGEVEVKVLGYLVDIKKPFGIGVSFREDDPRKLWERVMGEVFLGECAGAKLANEE